MKKLICTMLALIACVSLVACNSEGKDSQSNGTVTTIDAEAEAKAKAEAEAEAKEKENANKYDQATRNLKQGKYDEAITIFNELDGYKDSAECAVYAAALSYCEIGDYESAYLEMTKIPDYENGKMLLAQIYYETSLFEVINDYKVYLKNPDSLIVKEVKFTYEDDKGMTSTKERPACIINASAQNGFGGYTSSYVLGTFNEDKGKYVFAGSCDSLDYNDYDSDEWMTALTAMAISGHLENPEIQDVVDIDRVTAIITNGKFSSIKQLSDLTFDQFSDLLFGEATEDDENNSESEGVLT